METMRPRIWGPSIHFASNLIELRQMLKSGYVELRPYTQATTLRKQGDSIDIDHAFTRFLRISFEPPHVRARIGGVSEAHQCNESYCPSTCVGGDEASGHRDPLAQCLLRFITDSRGGGAVCPVQLVEVLLSERSDLDIRMCACHRSSPVERGALPQKRADCLPTVSPECRSSDSRIRIGQSRRRFRRFRLRQNGL